MYQNRLKYISQRTFTFILVFAAVAINWHCPHKPIDPGLEDDASATLFSLPAPPTDGQIEFKATQYRTKGDNKLSEYTAILGSVDISIIYAYAGSQIQFDRKVRPNGTTTYAPKWVISASRSAQDASARKNTIIISILPAFDADPIYTPLADYDKDKLWCDDATDDNISAANFCNAILGEGDAVDKPFEKGTTGEFKSYEAYLYANCYTTGNCDASSKPAHVTSATYNGTNKLDASEDASGDTNKDYFYSDYGTSTYTTANAGKKFQVVIEFLDSSGNLYTTKFPYNGQTDNLSNNTPVSLTMAAFADPRLDPATFTIGQANTYMATNDASTDTNCTSVQGNPNDAAADKNLVCSEIIGTTAATIASASNADDDIIHKMQLAGKEFRAKGNDIDPRFEMILRSIDFSVQRGANRFLD